MLAEGPARVKVIREACEEQKFSTATLYKVGRDLGVEEYESNGRKWWRLDNDEAPVV